MMQFCDHAKARLNERLPDLYRMIAEIEESVSKHVKDGYAENVDFWCKMPPRQCLRVMVCGKECYVIVNMGAIITVYDRGFAVRLKYGQKHKRKLKSRQSWDSRRAK